MQKLKNHAVLILVLFLSALMTFVFMCGCTKGSADEVTPGGDVTDTGDSGDGTGGGNTGSSGGNTDSGNTGSTGGDSGSSGGGTVTEKTLYIKIGENEAKTMQKSESDAETYTATVELAVGDKVKIYDSADVTYTDYGESSFDGVAKTFGNYVFTLTLTQKGGTIEVTEPQFSATAPIGSTVKVTFTNNKGWQNVYAYIYSVGGNAETAWPGKKLSNPIISEPYKEEQYTLSVDCSQYDRIIFNNGSGTQTNDLVLSPAVSGYYMVDNKVEGTFTMGADKYGKVEYFDLPDEVNLAYLPKKSKRISVYTPRNYSPDKKYGVIYMFDSQNLYAHEETGADKSGDEHGSWAVDVAVNNLVGNGGDGVIIVGIDNSDTDPTDENRSIRNEELTMSQDFGTVVEDMKMGEPGFDKGQLDNLGNFMRKTLIPWVNRKYSVDTRREKTGICGSSSGGLAAYYLGLRDNDIYGYIGALSPANGLFAESDWKKFYDSKDFGANKPKVYAYCGNGDFLEQKLNPAYKNIKTLTSYGLDVTFSDNANGSHNEGYWRIAFMEFLGKMAAYKTVV